MNIVWIILYYDLRFTYDLKSQFEKKLLITIQINLGAQKKYSYLKNKLLDLN